jgi:hypothetical protein
MPKHTARDYAEFGLQTPEKIMSSDMDPYNILLLAAQSKGRTHRPDRTKNLLSMAIKIRCSIVTLSSPSSDHIRLLLIP